MGGSFGGRFTSWAALAALIVFAVGASAVWPREPVRASRGMVVSVSPPATEVGLAALQRGGSAVDAAVAVAFALAVTFPEAGNIGGGGFMVVRPGDGIEPVVIDYREVAPQAAARELFATLDSRLGHKAVGVPGTVRGLAAAHRRFGRLPWKDVVQPAVEIAERGLILDAGLAGALNRLVGQSAAFPEFCRVYGKDGGQAAWAAGDRLTQPDLARTLRQIAEQGPDAFYRGEIADLIVAEMQRGSGLIAKEDLAAYAAQVKPPLRGTFRGYEILCPPPATGGTVLVEMLNILENFDLQAQGRWAPETVHLIIEAMRLAYFDRACYLADPQFVPVPEFLVGKAYARRLAQSIDRKRAGNSAALAGSRQIKLADEGTHTTHFSVIDKSGMAVANTYTLEYSYGSRVVVQGGGFLLNNEMGDFNWKPGRTDRSGTIGTPPNLIEPGKRMLSSQTPTIVTKDGRVVLITGSPGGRTIINTVLNVVLNVAEFQMDAASAVDAPRFHHQWLPDRVVFERRVGEDHPELMEKLKALGHTIGKPSGSQGDAHTIWVDPQTGERHGAADLRRQGSAMGY
ncbi:MAG: gamma-glutamyltransferase [Candidatus Anammoximicrobium sp.]|nr:gamma-glutamyltransferase [Candidatus Anammoximicrobium sp.]